jgi:hypothetical protein
MAPSAAQPEREMNARGCLGVQRGRRARLTASRTSMNRLSRKPVGLYGLSQGWPYFLCAGLVACNTPPVVCVGCRATATGQTPFSARLDSVMMNSGMIRQKSMSHARQVRIHRDRHRRRAKARACSSFSLTPRALFAKNSSWQAKQLIPFTTVTFRVDCVKMCEDFSPNFGDKNLAVTSRQRTVSQFLSHKGIVNRKPSSPTHPTFLCFPD